jgi:glycosyltransferase involved in cell wall biosynthesis
VKISTVIIARNEGNNIGKAIRLIREQNYPKEEIEVIVVSDGSRDDTVEKALQEGVRVVILKKSFGISVARNIGVLEATGEIIFFVDAHIFLSGDSFRALKQCFKRNSKIYGVCGKYRTPFEKLDCARNIRYKALSGKGNLPRKIDLDNFATFSSGIGAFRRSVFDKVGLFKESFRGFAGEDIFFELQILNNGMLLFFEPRIYGVHYEKIDNFRAFYKRAYKEVRGFCKVVISSIDYGLRMPRIDRYYLHFPLLLSISLILLVSKIEFITIFCLAILLEVIYIKNIWKLKNYRFKEKLFAATHCLFIALLKVGFFPVFVFQPRKMYITENIKAVVIDENRNRINKDYKFENNHLSKSYVPTITKRIVNILKLLFKWEIMKVVVLINKRTKLI